MTVTSDIPALTASDLVTRALEAARLDQEARQREQDAQQEQLYEERQEALAAEKAKFLRALRDCWGNLAGMPLTAGKPLDLTIDDDDLVYDGKHWLWQFQPGLKIGFDYNAARHTSVAAPFLMAHTAHNRSSYRLDSLAQLGNILQHKADSETAVEQQKALKLQREQEAVEERCRQEELDARLAEIDDREPVSPDPTVVLFEDGMAGVQVVNRPFALRLRPFRINLDGGPMWEFDLSRSEVQVLLEALEARTKAIIAPCGRLIVTRPAGPGVERLDEVLWMLLPSEYDTDYSAREVQGQVMVMRGVDTGEFMIALRDWIECATRRDAWEDERRAVLETPHAAREVGHEI